VLPKNSVGTAQLKKNAVTSANVKNRTLLAADFAKGQIPPGPPGALRPNEEADLLRKTKELLAKLQSA